MINSNSNRPPETSLLRTRSSAADLYGQAENPPTTTTITTTTTTTNNNNNKYIHNNNNMYNIYI